MPSPQVAGVSKKEIVMKKNNNEIKKHDPNVGVQSVKITI